MRLSRLLILFILSASSCHRGFRLPVQKPGPDRITGSAFFKQAAAMNWKQRDSFALKELLSGNMPDFLKKLVPVKLTAPDSSTGALLTATVYVSPDYVSIGTHDDWARIPLTPMAAQQLADTLHCFLPTPKLVDAIYKAASVKLEPVPLFAFRDSSPVMYQHHLIIEGQRKGRKGLIAGIKKDVVISGKLLQDARKDRVAIYGWHKPDGQPIQPVYTGHVNWYVDYSHGIRLIWRKICIGNQWRDYEDVLKDPLYGQLLQNSSLPLFFRY